MGLCFSSKKILVEGVSVSFRKEIRGIRGLCTSPQRNTQGKESFLLSTKEYTG